MMEFIKNSAFFGAMISLIAYEIGLILKKKFKMAIFNPAFDLDHLCYWCSFDLPY